MTATDFIPGFAKRKALYEKALLPDGKNHWQPNPLPEENAYRDWRNKVINPSTKEYYTRKHKLLDDDGNETGEEIEEKVRHTITQLVRLRNSDGKEYLYSHGMIEGFDSDGNVVPQTCSKWAEFYRHPVFRLRTARAPSGDHNITYAEEVEEIDRYTVPFSETNVDKLLQNKSPKGCTLTLKDTNGNIEACQSLEMFKTKSFDYIMNREWQTPQEKEIAIKEHEIMQGDVDAANKRKTGGNR